MGESFQILRPSSMRDLSRRVCSSGLTSSQYLMQEDAVLHHGFLEQGHTLQKSVRLIFGAETHHPFDAGAVVPAAIEDHHLAGRREVGHIALHVHLALLPVAGRRQGDHPEHARADTLGERLDGAALAGGVASLEHDADLEALVHVIHSWSLTSSTCKRASSFS
jgi:hypothetical protein